MAEREIQLVVNYGAGGSTDVPARAFARGLERQLGKPVVVVNRPAAEGTIGPAFVATQRPDGYTMGVVTYSIVAIQPHVRDLPYTIDSFDFIAGYGRFRYAPRWTSACATSSPGSSKGTGSTPGPAPRV